MVLNYKEPWLLSAPLQGGWAAPGGKICWEGMEKASHGGDGGRGVQKHWLYRPGKVLLPQLWGVCGCTLGERAAGARQEPLRDGVELFLCEIWRSRAGCPFFFIIIITIITVFQ